MKKTMILSLVLFTALFVSCSKASKLSNEAKETVKQTLHDLAKDPSSVQLSNVEPVFSNDSLCILHLNFTAKNGLGIESTEKIEYVYLVSGEKKYEAYQGLNSDSIYISASTFDKVKNGKIYENLSYESTLYYRAAIFINNSGRAVGDKAGEEDVKIPVPGGTGLWEVQAYEDEFGDKSDATYLRLWGKGTFSNSATTGSRMSAILFVSKTGFAFRFIEYDSHVVKDDEICHMRIKDAGGVVHNTWSLFNSRDGQMSTYDNDVRNEMIGILEREGEIVVSAEMGRYSKSEYRFKMDLTGYKQAVKYLK